MATNQTYSFLDIVASIAGPGGTFSLGADAGAAEEGITIAANGEINTMQVGAGGEAQHSLHADKSGKVAVNLLKTSPTNALLSALYAFQTSSASTHGQNTISIVDAARGDVVMCQQCAFKKAPDLSYAKDAGMVVWEFDVAVIDRTLG